MKCVCITGGAKGIGRAIALTFYEQGYEVCITYHTSLKEAKELEKLGVHIYEVDVTNKKQVEKMMCDIVQKFGAIDCLVNNAAICDYTLFQDSDEQQFINIIHTNLTSVHIVTSSVLNHSMIQKKQGCIINISSVWGMVGASMEVAYSASKAGIIGLTKALSKELAPSHIRVNSIAPGVIQTDMISKFSKEEQQIMIQDIPLMRLGNVQDVANLALFLASENASYITGQNIAVDGGMCL